MARSTRSTRTAPKAAPKKAAPSKKTAPKAKAKVTAKKATAVTRGPSKETVAFAAKVVKLRDSGLPWKVVAEKVGVPYTANGSSRLRRAYTIGNGATVGVRSAK